MIKRLGKNRLCYYNRILVGILDDAQSPSGFELPMEPQEGVPGLPADWPQSMPLDQEASDGTGHGAVIVADWSQSHLEYGFHGRHPAKRGKLSFLEYHR